MHPLVSILIPVYNSENYIGEAIRSAINQSWPNKEIIVVDDGSTDNSYNILKRYESPFFNIFKQEKKGACAARNLAFQKSKGEFIQYLDSDDILPLDKLEKQLSLLTSNDTETTLTCSWSHFTNDFSEAKFRNLPIYKNYDKPVNLLLEMISKRLMLQTSVWLTPRDIIKKAGEWKEDLLYNQDGEFFSRVILASKKIIYCPDVMVLYRQANNHSITRGEKTHAKAVSALNAINYIGYSLLEHNNSPKSKEAYVCLLTDFILQHTGFYKDLIIDAKNSINQLELDPLVFNSPRILKMMTQIFGFWNTIRIIGLYRNLKNTI